MSSSNQVPDKSLLQSVQRKLSQKCAGGKMITSVRSGVATVSGVIKNEHERKPILRTITGVQGIRRVIDQLRVEKRKQVVFQPREIDNAESAEPSDNDTTASEISTEPPLTNSATPDSMPD
ncbi:BON domain-containing protein [Neorhodopirellula pilleata]|nr:hypothetical protein [Neorhodopirellula pilleata]